MNFFSFKKFVGAVLFAAAAASPVFAELPAKPVSPEVRVLVNPNQKKYSISVDGEYRVLSLPDQKTLKSGEDLKNVPVLWSPDGIRFDGANWPVKGIRILASKPNALILNRSGFRGSLDILKDGDVLYAVNRVKIEDYLYGVLHNEVAAWWPMDALKAQAVAARTYALYEIQGSASRSYDLKSSTSSQVYGGSNRERYRTNKAVDLTRGQVLTWQEKVFPAYFHATCAGKTAAAQELWKINIPPLAGGVECGYCRISPHYSWQAKVPLSLIEEKLNAAGQPLGQIIKMEVVTATPSGRVGSVKITGTQAEFVIAAKDLRVWVGGDKIRSTRFTLRSEEDMAYFDGKGWGHGVGLCQWGTLGQSLLGHGYQDILKFYYPGAVLQKLEYQ